MNNIYTERRWRSCIQRLVHLKHNFYSSSHNPLWLYWNNIDIINRISHKICLSIQTSILALRVLILTLISFPISFSHQSNAKILKSNSSIILSESGKMYQLSYSETIYSRRFCRFLTLTLTLSRRGRGKQSQRLKVKMTDRYCFGHSSTGSE